MSGWMIAVVTVGGTVVLAGVLVLLYVTVGRRMNAGYQRRLRRLRAGVAAHGWRYEPRDDSYAHLIPGGTVPPQHVTRVEHVDELLAALNVLCPLFDHLPTAVRGPTH